MPPCSKICSVVRLRSALLQWLSRATTSAGGVPRGHIAVSVGPNGRRYVVRTTHLNHPLFVQLLAQAAEEYGYDSSGPLTIPCDEKFFEEIVEYLDGMLSGSDRSVGFEDFQQKWHVRMRRNVDFWTDSRPLLQGGPDKSIW